MSATDPTADAILDATLAVLGQRGLKGATTRLIAERAGVNEITLFRKFGRKNDLVKAALERQFSRVQEQAVQFTGDIEADLTALATRYRAVLAAAGPAARVVLLDLAQHPEMADVRRAAQRLFAAVADLLQRYQASGVLREEPVTALIAAFIGPIAMPIIVPPLAQNPPGVEAFDAPAHVAGFLYGHARSGPSTPPGR